MACCAFAVFLLLNLLIPIGLLRRSATSEKQNPAVAWRYKSGEQATVGAPADRRPALRPATVVLAVYLTGVALAAIYWLASDPVSQGDAMTDEQWDAFAALNVSWCLDGKFDTANKLTSGDAQ